MLRMKRKKVVIVGGGISGLTAGIYCLDNGFDVVICEKHVLPGGQCTGWYREGMFIDGCIHWLIGTKKGSDLYPGWKHIGMLDEDTKVFPTQALSTFQTSKGEFTFHSDLEQLESELLSFSPEDRKMIRIFIKGIRAYQKVRIPMKKPISAMNLWELIRFGLPMLPMVRAYSKYGHMSMKEFADKFQNKELGNLFLRAMREDYNVHAFLYVLQALSKGDAGMMEGGSLAAARRVAERFKSKGGTLLLNHEVQKVIYEKNQAKAVLFSDGTSCECDDLILACDLNYALHHLVPEEAIPKHFLAMESNPKDYPANTGFTLAYSLPKSIQPFPKQMDFTCEEYSFHGLKVTHIPLRNYQFDPRLSEGKDRVLFTVLLPATEEAFEGWSKLRPEDYAQAKKDLLNHVGSLIAGYLGVKESDVHPLDAATPKTYARYTNAYKGSYMSYVSTKKNRRLMHRGTLPHLQNVFLSGQWLMPPGGIPIALFTGKHAAYRVSKKENGRFIDLDEE